MILDLDPDPSLPWARMVEAATLTKSLLDELGLISFVKTSGEKGLHIVMPLARRHDWETVARFAQAVAQHLAATLPNRFSAKMGPKIPSRKFSSITCVVAVEQTLSRHIRFGREPDLQSPHHLPGKRWAA